MLTTRAAELIRRAREDAEMTQSELAAAAGIQQPTISQYESGAKVPRSETLQKILLAARTRPSMPLMVYANEIVASAVAHGLSNVRVFGSAVRGTDTERSDIDLLVSTPAGTSLFDLAGFIDDVEDVTGFQVDVLTDNQTKNRHLVHILAEAVPL